MEPRINLRSDTATQPSIGMRRAMAEAPVGDEQRREDPTVNRLNEKVAELLGAQRAIFLPSATMANQIAFSVHCRGGDEVIGHRLSHPFNHEAGGPAYLARVMMRPIDGERGMFSTEALGAAIREVSPDEYHQPRSGLLLVENTTNIGGGAVWPMEQIRAVAELAKSRGMARHLDGARLMNAALGSGRPAAEIAGLFDSTTLCFSKGLGAPVGAALAGSEDFIARAWRYKQIFGGAMRQAGIIAAAALYALEFNVERLAEDHQNATRLAGGIAGLPGIRLNPDHVQSNILVFEVDAGSMTAAAMVEKMAQAGVDFYDIGPQRCRLVTHMDLDSEMIELAIHRFQSALT